MLNSVSAHQKLNTGVCVSHDSYRSESGDLTPAIIPVQPEVGTRARMNTYINTCKWLSRNQINQTNECMPFLKPKQYSSSKRIVLPILVTNTNQIKVGRETCVAFFLYESTWALAKHILWNKTTLGRGFYFCSGFKKYFVVKLYFRVQDFF